MICSHMHVPATSRSKLLATPSAGESLGEVVDGVYMPGHIGCSGEGLVTQLTFVLGVLVLGLGMNGQSRLRFVGFATGLAFEWMLANFSRPSILMDILDMSPQAELLRE